MQMAARWLMGTLLAAALGTGCGQRSLSMEQSTKTSVAPLFSQASREARVALELQGRFVYERNCLVCHGVWGDGHGELATNLVPQPRNLRTARFKFRSTPSGFLPTDADLHRVITLGIAGTAMPTFAHLEDRDVTAVVVYLKTFSRRWEDPRLQGKAVAIPDPPSWITETDGRLPHVLHGQELFLSNCASCHGVQGRGDGPAAAALVDEDGKPALTPDFSRGIWKSGPQPADLYRTITTGMDGTPMPSFADGISINDRWDLVAFLSTLTSNR